MLTPQSRIEAALHRIITEGGNGNFVIASTGEYYVQFASEPDATEIFMEAVGNAYLDGDAALTDEQEQSLAGLGFTCDEAGNWGLVSEVNPLGLKELSAMAVAILRDIYGVSPSSIELTVELADRWTPDDAPLNAVLEVGDEEEITLVLRDSTLLLPAPTRGERFVDSDDGVVIVTGYTALEAWCPEGMGQYAVPGTDLFQWLWEHGVRRVIINPSGPGRTLVHESWLSRLAGIQ